MGFFTVDDGDSKVRLISSTVSYGKLLLDSMKSTYTDPFELQTENVIFGLDKINKAQPKRRKRESETKSLVQIPKYDNYMRNSHSWNTVR